MSTFLHKDVCPKCRANGGDYDGDNLAVYDDHSYCYACKHWIGDQGNEKDKAITAKAKSSEPAEPSFDKPITSLPIKGMPAIRSRGIEAATVNKYKVTVGANSDSKLEAVFPRFSQEGAHIGNQIRLKDKEFYFEGSITKATLFGQELFRAGGRSITITEGYYDTLASHQITGSKYPVVGVVSSSMAKKEVVNNFEYLNSFDRVVINFDSDEPGQKAAKEVAGLFSPGKAAIMSLVKAKDANEYLLNGWGREYVDEFFRAPPFMPDGLKLGSELWGEIESHKIPHSVPYPWDTLNTMTFGIRTSEVVLLTAPTGVGKTSFVKAIEHKLLMSPELIEKGWGVGLLHLEEPKYDTAIGLMSIEAQKPFHLPDTIRTQDELRAAYDAVINNNRLVIWDHFGSNDIDVVLAKVRHMAALGCKYIVVDHLSIIVSDQSGDERKQLDEISTKIKTLCMNLDIACICVIHLNRQGEIRGSAGPEQIANIVIRLERDKKEASEWRRNITKLTVEKNRFCGRTGPSSYLKFSEDTNCLTELTAEEVTLYEQGASEAGNEFAMYGKG